MADPGGADPTPTLRLSDLAGRPGPRPALPMAETISGYRPEQLIALVRWIESDTLLRTEEQVLDEVVRELGFQRKGPRIREAVLAAIRQARWSPGTPGRQYQARRPRGMSWVGRTVVVGHDRSPRIRWNSMSAAWRPNSCASYPMTVSGRGMRWDSSKSSNPTRSASERRRHSSWTMPTVMRLLVLKNAVGGSAASSSSPTVRAALSGSLTRSRTSPAS